MTDHQTNGRERILYIENDQTYCMELNKQLAEHPGLCNKLEAVPAVWLEEAYGILKKGNIRGVIIDLQLIPADKKTLALMEQEKLVLNDYAPDSFAGIGLILFTQKLFDYISGIPKIVISNYDFDSYEYYYQQMKGPKSFAKKHPDFRDNAFTAIKWLEKNY